MADTNLLVLAREYKKLREEVKKVLSMPKGDKGDPGEKGEKGDKGDTGPQGFPGRDGKDGITGFNGKDGRDGIDGKDGKDGLDGVGVQNAYIDFDNSLVIVLTDGTEVNAGFLSQETKDNIVATFKQGAQTLNELLPIQTGNAGKFLKTDGTNVSWDTLDGSDIDLASPPVIGNTTPNAATFTTLSTGALTATGQTSLGGAAGSESIRAVVPGTTGNYWQFAGSSTNMRVDYAGAATNIGSYFVAKGTGFHSFTTSGSTSVEQFRVSHTASAVNYVQVTGAATTVQPIISAQGSDTNIPLSIRSKGTGALWFGSSDGAIQFSVATTTSSVNRLSVAGAAATQEPVLSAQGSDTNISMVFQSKGTGGISLSTGSTGTNLVNGTTVTAITRTSAGGPYTSFPSIAISAPTTAGGVQATADVTGMTFYGGNPQAINNAGSGYTVNDVLTIVGGTGTPCTLRVTAVNGTGGVTAAAHLNFNNYTVLPAVPYSVTGGTGTGATFTSGWQVNTQAITNAGSGYVEQPTVTFSGGGGSGAAAYATVGAGTTMRTLGTPLSFFTPGGEGFRVADSGGANVDYIQANGSSFGRPVLRAAGSGNPSLGLSSQGTGSVQIYTNTTSQEQLRITHTASAVNYVQVTGAATGGRPLISVQGSDSAVNFGVVAKGNASVYSQNGNGTAFEGYASGNANYLSFNGTGAGSSPFITVKGSDTNIGLNLTTKGTGALSLNTGNGEAVRIVDSGGTTVNQIRIAGGNTFVTPPIFSRGSDTNVNLGFDTQGAGAHIFTTNSFAAQQFRVTHTASAVNYVQVTGAATGGAPTISAQGSDSASSLIITSKGGGDAFFRTGSTGGFIRLQPNAADGFQVSGVASGVNYLRATNSIATAAPILSAQGSDTNIDLALTPKGTGLVRFGTYTATALSIAGYIEIKDSGGTVRRLAVVA